MESGDRQPDDSGHSRPSRVLVVDDEPLVGQAIRRVLSRAGYSTLVVTDGTTALRHVAEFEPQAVVSDLNMPGFNGIEFLRGVRQRDRDLPVILITCKPDVDSAMTALNDGAFKYLQKPLDHDELVKVVGSAVRLHQLARLKREASAVLGAPLDEGSDRAALEASFENALSSLWPAYQPILSVSDRSVFGYEALLRSGEPRLPHPGAVLNAAERLGRVQDVGRTMRKLAVLPLAGKDSYYDLFLNLHPEDLADPDLLDPNAPHMPFAHRIVLEITERASLDGIDRARDKVEALREAGFRIAVDDLGAGYAGLNSFIDLEPDLVKLDMGLVRGVDRSATRQRLIRSMTHVCADMGLLVVAEGVETATERDALAELGCDLLQGYFFGRPERELRSAVWDTTVSPSSVQSPA